MTRQDWDSLVRMMSSKNSSDIYLGVELILNKAIHPLLVRKLLSIPFRGSTCYIKDYIEENSDLWVELKEYWSSCIHSSAHIVDQVGYDRKFNPIVYWNPTEEELEKYLSYDKSAV